MSIDWVWFSKELVDKGLLAGVGLFFWWLATKSIENFKATKAIVARYEHEKIETARNLFVAFTDFSSSAYDLAWLHQTEDGLVPVLTAEQRRARLDYFLAARNRYLAALSVARLFLGDAATSGFTDLTEPMRQYVNAIYAGERAESKRIADEVKEKLAATRPALRSLLEAPFQPGRRLKNSDTTRTPE
jgi:hypothetical protein